MRRALCSDILNGTRGRICTIGYGGTADFGSLNLFRDGFWPFILDVLSDQKFRISWTIERFYRNARQYAHGLSFRLRRIAEPLLFIVKCCGSWIPPPLRHFTQYPDIDIFRACGYEVKPDPLDARCFLAMV